MEAGGSATPAPPQGGVRRQLELVVRRERARLIAALVRELGGHRVDLAEDVAQDAMVAALATWPYRDMPDNPGAWLSRAARNKAVDRLRRGGRDAALSDDVLPATDADTDHYAARVEDDTLRLLFLCCHPSLSQADQLALMLRTTAGFTAGEIGELLLVPTGAMSQRLVRALRTLRDEGDAIATAPSDAELRTRRGVVLRAIYLGFSLGHAPRTGETTIRRDLMEEGIRLARALAAHETLGDHDAAALAALLCLQGARLDARVDANGAPVLLRDQDRSRWDRERMQEGVLWLQRAREAARPSRYHVEAGIAALHTLAKSWDACDWNAIVRSYEALARMVDSPVVRINAAVARAQAGDAEAAHAELERLANDRRLQDYAPFHLARAEIARRLERHDESAASYRAALAAGTSAPVADLIESRLASCL